MHERAVIDAVGDDANSPVCDGSDLRLLLVLSRRINCPRLRVARCGRGCGHDTLFSEIVTQVIHKRFLRQRTISLGIGNHGPQKLADNTRPQRWRTEEKDDQLPELVDHFRLDRRKMSHDHGHGGCGDHTDEHELPGNVLGYQDNLYSQIDRVHVVAFNANGQGQTVIKPWSERDDETSVRISPITPNLCKSSLFTGNTQQYLESDADDQLYALDGFLRGRR